MISHSDIPTVYKEISLKESLFYSWFEAMHTRIDIILCHLSEEKSKSLSLEIQRELFRLEKIMNRFDPESELAIINEQAGFKPLEVSTELAWIIQSCIKYYDKTFGHFDISIQSENRKDSIAAIELIQNSKGFQIFFKQPGIILDLGGFAKGYALDRCKILVEQSGCRNSLLNFGNSSILAMGSHPMGKGWKVNLEQPITQSPAPITLYNECLTTSENTANKQHIISPVSGDFAQQKTAVSVKTTSGEIGEVLSTALYIASDQYKEEICSQFDDFICITQTVV